MSDNVRFAPAAALALGIVAAGPVWADSLGYPQLPPPFDGRRMITMTPGLTCDPEYELVMRVDGRPVCAKSSEIKEPK
jgi:hypothetical protein